MKYFSTSQEQYAQFRFKEHLTEWNNNHEMTISMHIHSTAEILYVTKGKITLTIAGKKPEYIMPGQAALIFPYLPHEYHREGGTEYSRYNFMSSLVNGFFLPNSTKIGERCVFNVDEESIRPVVKKLYTEKKISKLKAKSFIYSFLSDFEAQVKLCEKTVDNDLFSKAIAYLNENKSQNITLADAAKEIGCCDKYLSKAINTVANVNFTKLLALLRVDTALSMLSNTDKTLLEISILCGFGSERNFYRSFKEITGYTPDKYRREKKFVSCGDNIVI